MSDVSPAIPNADHPATPLEFTAAAARRARELIREEDNPALKLRVSVDGGGCSGFQYEVRFDTEQAEDDLAIDRDGVTLLVDSLSLQYLDGAQVDYTEALEGSRFVVHNPNARTTCGCGTSFTV